MSKIRSPTKEFYSLLETAYDVFNEKLFNGTLTNCLLTVQREKKTMGYFSAERWINEKGIKTHEIALNPSYFANHKVIEIFQTLVHEMCHLWQHEQGKPSIRTYHNKEWAAQMESIGLMPSKTGYPGGKRTGQKMSDYPIPGGLFLEVCTDLIKKGITIAWFDRYAVDNEPQQPISTDIDTTSTVSPGSIELELLYTQVSELVDYETDQKNDEEPIILLAAKTKQKVKYTCISCSTNVWGKPNLSLICGECKIQFEAI